LVSPKRTQHGAGCSVSATVTCTGGTR
jgi:hydroxymethylpyrimidine/phosphomethylpyrimidine kinase